MTLRPAATGGLISGSKPCAIVGVWSGLQVCFKIWWRMFHLPRERRNKAGSLWRAAFQGPVRPDGASVCGHNHHTRPGMVVRADGGGLALDRPAALVENRADARQARRGSAPCLPTMFCYRLMGEIYAQGTLRLDGRNCGPSMNSHPDAGVGGDAGGVQGPVFPHRGCRPPGSMVALVVAMAGPSMPVLCALEAPCEGGGSPGQCG